MASPILSIITTAYNAEKYIEETVQSVLTSPIDVLYEYIVIDDGSSDGTLALLKKYEKRIRLFSHENIGESESINFGLKQSMGRYILVLSADDPLLTGEIFPKAIDVLQNNSNVVAVYPDWQIIDEKGEILKLVITPEYSQEILIGHVKCLPGPGTIFRKDAAVEIGGRRAKWKFVGDYDFWIRLSQVGIFQRLPEVLAQWRTSNESTSISQRGRRMAEERISVIEDFISEHPTSPKIARMARSNSTFLAARLGYFDSSISGRRLTFLAIIKRRGWPEAATPRVFLYLLLYPLSSRVVKKNQKFFERFIES